MRKANLIQQAQQLGIETNYFAVDGKYVEIDAEVLQALGSILADECHLNEEMGDYSQVLVVVPEQEHFWCFPEDWAVASGAQVVVQALEAVGENGVMVREVSDDGVVLPPLAQGYYALEVAVASGMMRGLVIVAPKQVYDFSQNSQDKLTGLSVQLYALRSEKNWGIGDFGDLAGLIEYAAKRSLDFIGLNPLHALFSTHPQWASPYSPSSRLWLNTIYLDMTQIPCMAESESAQLWLNSQETQARLQALRACETVDYVGVSQMKITALRYAYARFTEQAGSAQAQFLEFCEEKGQALWDFALFEALSHHFYHKSRLDAKDNEGGEGWLGWPIEYRDPSGEAVRRFARDNEDRVRFFAWLQWLMDMQLATLQLQAQTLGLRLGLYGDLAVGVARGGADTWLNQSLYCLQASVGAPPDALGPNGQNWQLPPMHPMRLQRSGFAAFIALLRANMRHFGILRIDHVMGLCRLWWIAFGRHASFGAYVRYPLEALMAILALESHRNSCVVIGEDLGIVSQEMRSALVRYGVFSYSVLYFSKDSRGFIAPLAFAEQAIAVVSTHDVAPLYGYWQGRDLQLMWEAGVFADRGQYERLQQERAQDKATLMQALVREGLWQDVMVVPMSSELNEAVHAYVAQAPTRLLAVQLENLMAMVGSFNLPGVGTGYDNWAVKLPLSLTQLAELAEAECCLKRVVKVRMQVQAREYEQKLSEKLENMEVMVQAVEGLSESERWMVEALFLAQLGDPFAFLGLHFAGAQWVVRVLMPEKVRLWLVARADGQVIGEMRCVDKRGFFMLALTPSVAERLQAQGYLLRYEQDGGLVEVEDVYRFASLLSEDDHWLLAQGAHWRAYEFLGAHERCVEGVWGINFCVWAPQARRVSVVGDFNAWDGRVQGMRFHLKSGVWEIFIPQARLGQCYKYEILGADGVVRLKADPYAFKSELRPNTASIIAPLPKKVERLVVEATGDRPMSIYEVHLGSWRRDENGAVLSYEVLAQELVDYVVEMGFTHIECLPLSEHPFDGSWGYQPVGLYAPTVRYGEALGLQALVAQAHAAGIGVILDWVVGHFPADGHGLAQFDGTALYEHADPREGFHQDWQTLIYNYGCYEVRNYLGANALYWLERFGFDGLRVDAVASMIYRDYSRKEGQWVANIYGGRENLEAIEFLKQTNAQVHAQMVGAVSIAEESTSFAGVTHEEGLGFDFKWNMGWMNDTLRYMQIDPLYRCYHHDLLTFAMVYQYSERFVLPLSHDEVVHGKGSILARMPGDTWQKFANVRAYYGFMWGFAGKKLLFMGNEFAQGREWNANQSLDWHLLDEEGYKQWHGGVQRWVRDLNHCYQRYPALYALDHDPRGFEWLVVDDAKNSVVVFERRDDVGGAVIVMVNFTPQVQVGYRFGVARSGVYEEILNSDATIYNGSGVGNGGAVVAQEVPSHGREWSLSVTLPALAAVFLRVPEEG